MASTEARAVPIKGLACRVTFPILDADGDLVTGATGLDSEVSKDAGTFADCTNEATEIATSSGMYYLDLTSTEMTADTVAIIVKTTSSGAKTTPIVINTRRANDGALADFSFIGTATAGASSTVTLPSGFVATNDYYNGQFINILAGTGIGQSRQIVDFVGATGVATVYVAGPPVEGAAWATTPDNTSVVMITPFAITPTPVIATAGVVSASISTATVNTIRKNTALANYPFKMVDATDLKTPETGVTVTAERMIDGGTFAACANAVTEDSLGWYHISLATTDLNGDTIVLKFTGTGCATTEHVIITQPT